ncbi:hypothetical protein I3760_04G026600 [Carya illinoinensis]|nr:hypothetical protein I3760_04G026600 [Carya illinoinensis]
MGSRSLQPRVVYAMDDALDEEEDPRAFWMFAQKFWLPVFLFLTVLTNLDHPIALIAIKIIFLLLSTNPSPLSVYVFVGQLCHQSMRKEPHLYRKKVCPFFFQFALTFYSNTFLQFLWRVRLYICTGYGIY